MADHEDYLPGEAPAAHKTTHQDGGTDEISVSGLSGVSAELAAHALLPTVHQDAPDLILTHKGDASAHHAKYTDAEAEAVADTQIGTHAALPTVHQDAPDLILTHKGDASAHHAKYTDAEVRVLFSPISVPAPAFIPRYDTYDFYIQEAFLYNRVTLTTQQFYAPVYFPNSVTITKVTLYGYRGDSEPSLILYLHRGDRAGSSVLMASMTADWTGGAGTIYDDSISYATIDNALYTYVLQVLLKPVSDVNLVGFYGALVEFTG